MVTIGDGGEGNTLLFTLPAASLRVLWAGAITGSERGSAVFWPLCANRLSGSESMRLLTGSFLTSSVLSA